MRTEELLGEVAAALVLHIVASQHRRDLLLMRGEIVRRFVAQGLALTLAGCGAGIALAAAFPRVLAGMLYGVSPSGATAWAGVVAIVLGVALAASLVPAVRAARLEPMQVLRDE